MPCLLFNPFEIIAGMISFQDSMAIRVHGVGIAEAVLIVALSSQASTMHFFRGTVRILNGLRIIYWIIIPTFLFHIGTGPLLYLIRKEYQLHTGAFLVSQILYITLTVRRLQ